MGVDLASRKSWSIADISTSEIDLEGPVSIYMSPGDELAAITNTQGEHGLLLELNTGKTLMNLKRDDYHCNVCTFPLAFFVHAGRELLVHGTEWNRLDITDPRSGECLTKRNSPAYRYPNSTDAHYLDYFHSSLSISPNSKWIIDDGWMWQPWGLLTSWNINTWLADNVWESEDGKTRRTIHEGDDWDRPLAWIDNERLAVAGYVDEMENEQELPAIFVYNLETQKQEQCFQNRVFAELNRAELVFDEFLIAHLRKSNETLVIDIKNGNVLHREKQAFFGTYHRPTRQFVTYSKGTDLLVSRFER